MFVSKACVLITRDFESSCEQAVIVEAYETGQWGFGALETGPKLS